MLMKPDIHHARAMSVLRLRAEWVTVTEYLKGELSKIYEQMTDSRDPVALHQLQGRAQALKEFLKAVDEAPQTAEKMERNK